MLQTKEQEARMDEKKIEMEKWIQKKEAKMKKEINLSGTCGETLKIKGVRVDTTRKETLGGRGHQVQAKKDKGVRAGRVKRFFFF